MQSLQPPSFPSAPAIVVFSVYMCGSLMSYLWKFPQLCPQLAPRAEQLVFKSLNVLTDLHQAWPACARWQQSLQQIQPKSAEVILGAQLLHSELHKPPGEASDLLSQGSADEARQI